MSKSLLSNMRAMVRPSGRFFVLCPSTKMDASFLCAQNSSDVASSNGCTTFFFENDIVCGRLSAIFTPQRNQKVLFSNIIVGSETTDQIFHCTIDNLASVSTTNKNDGTWVLDFLRFTSFQGSFGSCILGLTDFALAVRFPNALEIEMRRVTYTTRSIVVEQ